MKIKTISSIACVVPLLTSFVFGQDLPAAATISWTTCVAMASQKNPGLISSQRSLDSSIATYKGSYNGVLPGLSLSHSYSNSENTTISGGITSTTGGSSSNWQTSGQLGWDFFNMTEINNIRISKSQRTQTEANLLQASATLRFNLAKAFYQLLFSQENIVVSRNIVAMRDKEAELVALRYDSGTEYKGNKLRANAQLLQANADLAQSIRDLRTAQRSLDQQLGLDEFTVIGVTSTLAINEPGDLPNDLEPILNSRPDVILQKAVLNTSELSLSQSKSSLWPSLSANYTLATSGPNEFSGAPHSGWGVGLSYPLFAGGPTATYYAVAAAKNNLEKSKQDLRSVREQALSDIETSWSGFMGALDQIKVQTALLESARTRNDEADIRYNSGLMTYDNWEIIASDRINQEHQAILAQLNALNAEAVWARSLGKQLEE